MTNAPEYAEDRIAAYPALYREYLELERALCGPYDYRFPTALDERIGETRADHLFKFFRFQETRAKFNTNFWDRVIRDGSHRGAAQVKTLQRITVLTNS